MKSFIILLITIVTLSSCSTVPGTGRKQLTLIPSGQMLSMSYQQYDDVIGKAKISTDMKTTAMVRRVGKRIARAVEDLLQEEGVEMKFDWEFNLIEDNKQANAWCMPGGKIAVYTGILPYTKDEAGLAVVMGHEVAHAVARHGNERMTQGLGVQLSAAILGYSLSEKDPATQKIFMGAFGAAAQYGLILPFGRSQESESDRIGLQLMARAGYDPHAAIGFWQRMSKSQNSSTPEFLSTHPSGDTRIQDINKHLPEALRYYSSPNHR